MSGFATINADLDKVSKDIESTTYDVDIAREEYLLKKSEYENAFAMVELETKAINPDATQTDIEATAETKTHALRNELVMKDSAYKRCQNKLTALRDRLSALMEVAYNLRREATIR